MINLLTLFKNHFDTARISDDNLKKFAQDHLQRLLANNGLGQYTQTHVDTDATYKDYFTNITKEDTRFALQQAKTKIADTAFDEFKKIVSQKEGIVRGNFGIDSPEYQEFFPQGLTEYSVSTKANIETLMQRLADAFIKYQGVLGAGLVTIFTDIQTRYLTARNEQLQQIAITEASNSATAASRNALEMQLMKNILLLAMEFLGNPNRANDFFDQSIIRPNSAAEDGTINGDVLAGETVNIESQGITSNTKIKLRNKGTVMLIFGIVGDAITAATQVSVQPNKTVTLDASDLGNPSDGFLNVTNPDTTVAGGYEVVVF